MRFGSLFKPKEAPVKPTYQVKYTENEISVYSHPDGYILKKGDLVGYRRLLYSRDDEIQWENEDSDKSMSRYGYYLVKKIFASKESAIEFAQKEERELDRAQDERIRRENFVEQKVWR